MITLRGRELRRRGRHPRSAGRDRGARRCDRRRPVRRGARRPRRVARRGGARAALADHGVGGQRGHGAEGRPAAGEVQRGAAYDPQEDAVFYPRGRPKRVPAGKPEKTSIVRLEWYVPAERWAAAPAELIATLARRCPEALPTRYGDIEPLQQRYDPEQPDAFAAFIGERDVWTFWFSSRPSFGGHATIPSTAPGHSASTSTGACSTPTRGGARRSPGCSRRGGRARRALRRVLGGAGLARVAQQPPLDRRRPQDPRHPRSPAAASRACPPEPAWLTWFGGEYRDPVAAALDGVGRAAQGPRAQAVTPAVTPRDGGLCVRLGERPRAKLPRAAAPGRAAQAAGLSRRSTSAVKPG